MSPGGVQSEVVLAIVKIIQQLAGLFRCSRRQPLVGLVFQNDRHEREFIIAEGVRQQVKITVAYFLGRRLRV